MKRLIATILTGALITQGSLMPVFATEDTDSEVTVPIRSEEAELNGDELILNVDVFLNTVLEEKFTENGIGPDDTLPIKTNLKAIFENEGIAKYSTASGNLAIEYSSTKNHRDMKVSYKKEVPTVELKFFEYDSSTEYTPENLSIAPKDEDSESHDFFVTFEIPKNKKIVGLVLDKTNGVAYNDFIVVNTEESLLEDDLSLSNIDKRYSMAKGKIQSALLPDNEGHALVIEAKEADVFKDKNITEIKKELESILVLKQDNDTQKMVSISEPFDLSTEENLELKGDPNNASAMLIRQIPENFVQAIIKNNPDKKPYLARKVNENTIILVELTIVEIPEKPLEEPQPKEEKPFVGTQQSSVRPDSGVKSNDSKSSNENKEETPFISLIQESTNKVYLEKIANTNTENTKEVTQNLVNSIKSKPIFVGDGVSVIDSERKLTNAELSAVMHRIYEAGVKEGKYKNIEIKVDKIEKWYDKVMQFALDMEVFSEKTPMATADLKTALKFLETLGFKVQTNRDLSTELTRGDLLQIIQESFK